MSGTSASVIESEVLRSKVRRGMVLMATGVLMAPGIHAIAKGLGDDLSPGQIAWFRFFFQFVFLLPFVLAVRRGRLPRPSSTHGLRGLLLALATLAFFWALTYMSLADCAAIFFVEPLILALMSVVFLGEGIGWRRLLAVLVGFAGALIVIRPSFESVGMPAFLPLIAAACFAFYLTITRAAARAENATAVQFWVCVFGMLVLSLAMATSTVVGWTAIRPAWPAKEAWAWLILVGVIATISHLLAIRAFRPGPGGRTGTLPISGNPGRCVPGCRHLRRSAGRFDSSRHRDHRRLRPPCFPA